MCLLEVLISSLFFFTSYKGRCRFVGFFLLCFEFCCLLICHFVCPFIILDALYYASLYTKYDFSFFSSFQVRGCKSERAKGTKRVTSTVGCLTRETQIIVLFCLICFSTFCKEQKTLWYQTSISHVQGYFYNPKNYL